VLWAALAVSAGAQQPSVPSTAEGAQPDKPVMSQPAAGATGTSAGSPDAGASDNTPQTVKSDGSVGIPATDGKAPDSAVFAPPPMPKGKTSLIGGRVEKIDGIRNKLSVKVFGGGKWTLNFDERTRIYRDGEETTYEGIRKGDRVYVDTMMDDATHHLLARNIRVVTKTGPADARGQIVDFQNGEMTIADNLSTQTVGFQVTNTTQVKRDGRSASLTELKTGALIAVQFSPDKNNSRVATEITLLAVPGEKITFAGRVTHLDLSSGEMGVQNRSDDKTYDISLNPQAVPANLTVGSDVMVDAVFDGKEYKANRISLSQASQISQSENK
jgi:hypothetical protein